MTFATGVEISTHADVHISAHADLQKVRNSAVFISITYFGFITYELIQIMGGASLAGDYPPQAGLLDEL